jgi:cytoskeleton protein RodZ
VARGLSRHNVSAIPQAIGDALREARMRQKIDITEIEAKTKIRAKYLRAMENEEFDLLPGSTFAKSFLRTYADALGLDAHRLVEEYRSQYEPRDEGDLPPLSAQGRRPGRDRRYERRPPGRGFAIVALVLVAIIVLVVIGLASNGGNSGKKTPTTASDRGTATKRHHKRRHHRAATVPKRVTVRITPTVPTYLCVDRGAGKPPIYQGITAQTQSFRGRHIRVNLGKTSVTLTANGKRVPLTVGPNPAGIDFTPRTHKDIPVGQRPCA